MKNEERNPMKLLKSICTRGLMILMALISVVIATAVLVQVISLSFYTFLFIAALASTIYFFTRSSS
tara:strand:+ start:248 stop:445 length:198 start_codon:yes stop_codon:yes gene_type:complete